MRYYMQDVELKGAWGGPAALELFQHVDLLKSEAAR